MNDFFLYKNEWFSILLYILKKLMIIKLEVQYQKQNKIE